MIDKNEEIQDVLDQLSTLAPGAADGPQTAAQALRHIHRQLDPAPAGQTSGWYRRVLDMFKRQSLAVGFVLVLFAVLLFSFPAVRAAGSDFLGLFRVQKFAPVSISPEQMAMLEQLAEQGMAPGELDIRHEPGALLPMNSLAEAGVQTGLEVRTLAALGEPQEIYVVEGGDGTLIINLTAARAIMQAAGADPTLLPDSLDGARVNVVAFPGVQQVWDGGIAFTQAESPLVEYPADVDPVVLGEALLQVLGTEPREARRIARSIDWASTLLLPIPREMVTFSEVSVDGVIGAALAPLDGEGGAVMWQKDGYVYLLTTQGSLDDLLALLDSLG